jgi:hypothetical protein
MLCLTPQWEESATRLAYLIFIGGIPLLLLGLSRSPRSRGGQITEWVVVGLLGLSGPLVVFFSPAYAYRWLRERTLANGVLAGVVAATAGIQLIVFALAHRPTENFGFVLVPRGYLQRVVGELLVSPGTAETAFEDKTWFRWVTAAWLIAVLVVLVLQRVWDALIALALSGFAFAWAIRTYGDSLFAVKNGNRHMLVPGSILLVVTVSALAWSIYRAAGSRTGALDRRGPRWWDYACAAVSGAALLASVVGVIGSLRISVNVHVPTHEELVAFQQCLDEGRRDCPTVQISPLYFLLDANHPWDPESY